MKSNYQFFIRLLLLSAILLAGGMLVSKYNIFSLPTMFTPLIGFYTLISVIAFTINIKGTQTDNEIAVWYYLSSVMLKFLLAATSVFVLTKLYVDEKAIIVWVSFILYPLYEAVVTIDIYKRIRS